MSRIVMGKLAVGALVCALTVGTAGEAKARWGSSGGSWGSSGGSSGSSGGSWGSSGGSWGSSGGSWGSSGGSWGRRSHHVYYGSWGSSGGSWGSSGGSWGSSGGSSGSSGGSVGVVTSTYASPYVTRSKTVVTSSTKASLTVSVPADARVYINGRATSSTGTMRQYASPNLSQGKTYTYEVRAEANRGGQVVKQTETVQLRAGETRNLAFRLDQPRAVETGLTLNVPEDAVVVLAGEATTATGSLRTYKTAHLNAGQEWSNYAVQVSVVRNGQTLKQEKTISLVGGRQESLRFTFAEQQVAAR